MTLKKRTFRFNMPKQTQEQWIVAQLQTKGSISRNEALKHYCSRLGARICDLRSAGMNIVGEWIKTKNGRDFRYTLIK